MTDFNPSSAATILGFKENKIEIIYDDYRTNQYDTHGFICK